MFLHLNREGVFIQNIVYLKITMNPALPQTLNYFSLISASLHHCFTIPDWDNWVWVDYLALCLFPTEGVTRKPRARCFIFYGREEGVTATKVHNTENSPYIGRSSDARQLPSYLWQMASIEVVKISSEINQTWVQIPALVPPKCVFWGKWCVLSEPQFFS